MAPLAGIQFQLERGLAMEAIILSGKSIAHPMS
jgi:hypothetical protein